MFSPDALDLPAAKSWGLCCTLPPEIIMLILENLPDSATLLTAILSCRQVYDAVKPYIPSVLHSIVISQIVSLHDTSNTLYEILKSVHPAPRDFRDLQDQARFLTQTLAAFKGAAHDCGGDILALELPLQQCDMQCASIALKIAKCIVQPRENVIRRWECMISSYNLTFRVALGKARLCVSAHFFFRQ